MSDGTPGDGSTDRAEAFREGLHRRAAALRRRIGFPELHDERIRAAIGELEDRGWMEPVGVAAPDDPGADPSALAGTPVLGPGDTGESLPPEARESSLLLAVHLLRDGVLDGVVAGAATASARIVRAGLDVLGTAPGVETVSSSFYMILREPTAAGDGVLTFTDAGVVPDPTAGQLVEIAMAASDARRKIVGDEPRVAFLSYSTKGSAGGDSVERMRAAAEAFRERRPDVVADGELQGDAALVPDVARRKSPDSPVEGRASVLVFPDLDAANISYKLVQRLGGAMALGPILQGFPRALNDLSRGTSVEEIVDVACITALETAPSPGEGPDGSSAGGLGPGSG